MEVSKFDPLLMTEFDQAVKDLFKDELWLNQPEMKILIGSIIGRTPKLTADIAGEVQLQCSLYSRDGTVAKVYMILLLGIWRALKIQVEINKKLIAEQDATTDKIVALMATKNLTGAADNSMTGEEIDADLPPLNGVRRKAGRPRSKG